MEGVSSAASILQIADLCARLGTGLYKLASNLRHLPADFRRKHNSVSELQQAVDSIGADLRQPSPCPIRDRLSNDALLRLLRLLRESHKETVGLEHILDDALPQLDDNSFTRHRRTLRAMAKREDIQGRLDRLQELRSQLSIWYQHQLLTIATSSNGAITEVAQTTAQSEFAIRSLQGQIATISDGANLLAQDRNSISVLGTHVETLASDLGARIGTAESSLGDRMSELKGDINGKIGTVQTSINGLADLMQSSTRDLDVKLRNGLDQMCSSFENYVAKQGTLELSEAANQRLADTIVARLVSTPSLLADSIAVTHRFRGPGICPCRRIGKQNTKMKIGPLTLHRRVLGIHSPGCVFFGQESKTLFETGFSLLLTRLVSRSLEIQFGIRYGAGGFSISDGCGAIVIVDKFKGPGFSRFNDAERALNRIFRRTWFSMNRTQPHRENVTAEQVESVQTTLLTLRRGLCEDLSEGIVSANVKDRLGNTLLHALAELLVSLWYIQESTADIVNNIIQDLVNGGVQINATAVEPHAFIFKNRKLRNVEHTALSKCLTQLHVTDVILAPCSKFLPLLSDRGVSAYNDGGRFKGDGMLEIGLLSKNPDLAIELGCSRLSIEIVDQNREEVKHLIRNQADVNDAKAAPYSPLCFTLGWPIGMDILLTAGADPSSAIHCAICYEDDIAVKMLLERGSSLFMPATESEIGFWGENHGFRNSVLSYALWQSRKRRNFHHRILPLVVEALVRSRRRLMKLARDYISIPTLRRLGWESPGDDRKLLDSAANAVVSELQAQKISIPDFMKPGPGATVYHNPWMTAEVAEALFMAGFEEIDILDYRGLSPLLLNCHNPGVGPRHAPVETFLWLLEHGAKHVVFPNFMNISIVQKLAGNLSYIWVLGSENKHAIQETTETLSVLLRSNPARGWFPPIHHRDACTCFCSIKGCTPIQTLFRSVRYGNRIRSSDGPKFSSVWSDRLKLLQLWNKCVRPERFDYSNHREACRFELFSRLGMRHTCTFFTCHNTYDLDEENKMFPYLGHEFDTPSEEEIVEIQDEDRSLNFQLEAFMNLYMKLEEKYIGNFMLFWEAWWEVLQQIIPMEVWKSIFGKSDEKVQAEELPIHEDELEGKLRDVREGVALGIERRRQKKEIRTRLSYFQCLPFATF